VVPRTRQQRTGRVRHDPAWQIPSYGLLTAELANGEVCASPYGEGIQHAKRALGHQENLGNHTCKHHSRPASTDKRRCARRSAGRSDTQNPIVQRLPTTGSCMRGFRTPYGTRNPSPHRTLRQLLVLPESGRVCNDIHAARRVIDGNADTATRSFTRETALRRLSCPVLFEERTPLPCLRLGRSAYKIS
jgi:hypothetical protein